MAKILAVEDEALVRILIVETLVDAGFEKTVLLITAKAPPAGLFERDWREDLSAVVHDWCQERGLRPAHLSRDDRGRLVAFLDGRGAFEIRRAASHLAEIVGVSRATVYAALQQSRAGADDAA